MALSFSGIRASQPPKRGLLDRFKRLLVRQRRLRRLDGEPLLQDFIGGRHTVSYLRHLARVWSWARAQQLATDALANP